MAKFDSGPPITLQGEWNVDVGIPAYYAYGQGDGTEGSGYIGGDIGTKQDVAGGFNFVVDKSGEIIKDTIRRGLFGFFTLDWPIGDPATDDFWFCGLPSLPGKPYCEAHVGVAFQPMSARRDRRR